MKLLIGGRAITTPDATHLRYKTATSDPVSTAQVVIRDNTSSLTVNNLDELLILDEGVTPNPTINLLLNPCFNPYNANWTAYSNPGVTLGQITGTTVNGASLYLSAVGASTLNHAELLFSLSGTPAFTGSYVTIGTTLGWGEITNTLISQAWAGASAPGAPSSFGWLFDSTALQGDTLLAGTWTFTASFYAQQGGIAGGTLTGDLLFRSWKYNSRTQTYTFLTSSLLSNQTIGGLPGTQYTWQPASSPAAFMDVGDLLYIDLWFNAKTLYPSASNLGIALDHLSTDSVGKTGDSHTTIMLPSYVEPPGLSVIVSNASASGGTVCIRQVTPTYGIVPGNTYCLSWYVTSAAAASNVLGTYTVAWLDANQNFHGVGGIQQTYTLPGNGAVGRFSGQFLAPAGAAYARVDFGIETTSGTNSASFVLSNVMLEPQWFALQAYPTPFCGPNAPLCQVFGPTGHYLRQYRKFGGVVNHVTYGDYHGKARSITVDAVGYAWFFSSTHTATTFTNAADNTILSSLLSRYYGTLYGTSGIVQGVPSISYLQPNWDDLRTVIDDLAAMAGYYWTVDAYWQFVYQPPGYVTMPIALLCDESRAPDYVTSFPAYGFSAEMDGTQPGSNILVIGASSDSTTLNQALTQGTAYTSLSVQALPAAIASGTSLLLGTSQLITLSAGAAASATSISVTSFVANKNYGLGTSLRWAGSVALVSDPAQGAAIQRALFGNGTVTSLGMRKITDLALLSTTDCINRGLAELLQYDYARFLYHLSTNVELLSGQGVPVTSNTDGLAATTLLIQSVQATWRGYSENRQDVWEYQAELGAVNRNAAHILARIFRHTTRNVDAPPITTQALVAFEKLGLTDVAQEPYALVALQDGPAAYYRFNEPAGTNAFDASGNGYNGTQHGGVTLGAPGLIALDANSAYGFDGSTGYVSLPTTGLPAGAAPFSLECWFQTTGSTSYAGYPVLISLGTRATGEQVNLFFNTAGQLQAEMYGLGQITGAVPQVGVAHYALVTYDGATLRLYLDNVLQGTQGGTTNLTYGAAAIGALSGGASNFFGGVIDEPAVYPVALSATREGKHYKTGVTGYAS